jgi:hypothetical protein
MAEPEQTKAKEHSLKKNLIGSLKEQALGMRRTMVKAQ